MVVFPATFSQQVIFTTALIEYARRSRGGIPVPCPARNHRIPIAVPASGAATSHICMKPCPEPALASGAGRSPHHVSSLHGTAISTSSPMVLPHVPRLCGITLRRQRLQLPHHPRPTPVRSQPEACQNHTGHVSCLCGISPAGRRQGRKRISFPVSPEEESGDGAFASRYRYDVDA